MKELSEEHDKQIAEFVAALNAEQEAMNIKVGELNEAIQRYNNTLKNVRDFCTNIAEEIEVDEESDWKEDWEGAEFSDAFLVDEFDEKHAATLEELPRSPE